MGKSKRLYIIGAGFAGRTLANEISKKAIIGDVVAFLDDDPEKIGRRIDDIPVLGPIRDVALLLRTNPADEAIIAIPSASREYLKELYAILKAAGVQKIRILGNDNISVCYSIVPYFSVFSRLGKLCIVYMSTITEMF